MREAGAEEGPVQIRVARRLRDVNIVALGAVDADHLLAGMVGQSDGQHMLALAVGTRTRAKGTLVELLQHQLDAPIGEDEAGVDQSVQLLGAGLKLRLRGRSEAEPELRSRITSRAQR